MAKKKSKKKQEFSKTLLVWETVLIWLITAAFIGIVIYCVANSYTGDLAWLSVVYGFPWAAYGVSQACYYKKAEKENTKGGIKYDSVVRAAEKVLDSTTIEKIREVVHMYEDSEDNSDGEEAVG